MFLDRYSLLAANQKTTKIYPSSLAEWTEVEFTGSGPTS